MEILFALLQAAIAATLCFFGWQVHEVWNYTKEEKSK